MDRILYTASGAAARMLEQQAVVSNNLANVNTTGFRQQLSMQRAVPFVADQGLPTRVATVAATQGSDLSSGPLAETGNPLHVALQGPGWFAVRTPEGEAYTRAGEFAVNAENQLVTRAQGYPVLSVDGEPMEIPDRGTVTFSSDGQLTALGAGDPPNTIQVVGQIKLVNPQADSLQRGEDGFFRSQGQAAVQADPGVRIVSGFLEKSNVNAAQAMVALIENARQFEMQMKVIRDASANAERANGILSAGN
ncbi:flagellar basal-body rod protein FlgF [Pusillimonas sp. CC-YST705]|uniref:Flagellar basal-body rod protein FlgF n=1 Tax=Mesopusillimonas faecipullorum TaxID=2755040 RepID=A0ABS8C9W1_9BURK|nr:flagellar basal-body rod protein FlgF [Mesopusillimonas faecipullorum]MCB5362817.1 flagellar basal-body rod protein FlgF [Mesopusillimonas faecipullorum]